MDSYLFIGGAGYIGSSIIRLLKSRQQSGMVVLEPPFANLSRLDGLNVRVFRGFLCDIDLIESIIKANHITKVIHLVSTMVPGSGYEEFKKEYENVMFPTIRIMQLCSRENVQFIYFSSGGTVYGERKTLEPFVETDPKEPISYYGLSKQMIENSIQFEHRVSNLQYLVLRPSNPYGPGQNVHGRQGFIAVALGKVLDGESITVWGDGTSVRDYIYIDDLSEVVVRLLENKISNTTINIGSGVGCSINEVLETIKRVIDEPVSVVNTPRRKNDVSNMVLCNDLMQQYVNLKLTSLEDGIRKFYKHLKEQICKYE